MPYRIEFDADPEEMLLLRLDCEKELGKACARADKAGRELTDWESVCIMREVATKRKVAFKVVGKR